MQARVLATAVLLVGLVQGTAFARTGCPTSSLCRTSTTDSVASCFDGRGGFAHFDLQQGQYNASASNSSTQFNGVGFLGAWDRFKVTGVPTGTPLSFTAELQVNGTAFSDCGASRIYAAIENPATSQSSSVLTDSPLCSSACCSNRASLLQTLSLSVSAAAGDDFILDVVLNAAAGNTTANIAGQLRFAGLPEGAVVTSCQGFQQVAVTRALSRTWGAVKLLYR